MDSDGFIFFLLKSNNTESHLFLSFNDNKPLQILYYRW
jgi:hypothetical protein